MVIVHDQGLRSCVAYTSPRGKANGNKTPGTHGSKTNGAVLGQACMHLPSATMDAVMTYFRPENKFPDRVFGGFARELNNPCICSLDLFSYVTFPVGTPQSKLPQGWSLHESTHAELWELEQFYKHQSGGLLLDVLNFSGKDPADDSLEKVSRRLGFLRKLKVILTCSRILSKGRFNCKRVRCRSKFIRAFEQHQSPDR